MKTTLAILIASAAAPAFAEDLLLRPPLECGLDSQAPCIIQQYVDTDPSENAADFACGALSYDGHKGTDFRVPTLADMRAGVSVVASATGKVKATRDGMTDMRISEANAADVTGRECGNGLVLDHGNGWETQYCHLQQGSITVSKGDQVSAGTLIGKVGLSGRTAFPHVHLSVRKNGQIVDPFNPGATATCGAPTRTLWGNPDVLEYSGGGILDVGFHDGVPKFEALKQGSIKPASLKSDAPALVLWAYVFGGKPGDTVAFDINGPQGLTFQNETTLERQQAELFRASGKRGPPQGWPEGTYTGTVRLSRDGAMMQERQVVLQIDR